MTTKSFEVPNISCAGCVQAIKIELSDMPGVASVSGDPASRRIKVDFEAPATWDGVVAALKEIEYPPATEG